MGIGAGLGAIGSLFSGMQNASGAAQAGQDYAQAAQQASDYAKHIYNQAKLNQSPYTKVGAQAAGSLGEQLGQLSSQFVPNEETLRNTPGYQFDLSQGLKGLADSSAARGLGVSGAALKGAANYATGLADNTLNTQFNIDQANKTNAYNKLMGTSQLGSNAASNINQTGIGAAGTVSNALMGGAAGQAGSAMAQAGAFNPLLNNLGNFYNQATGSNPYGGGPLNSTGMYR